MKISGPVRTIINRAYTEAKARNHEYLTPEHILYAALEFGEVQAILEACGADLDNIKHGMENFFDHKIPVISGADPIQTVNFQSVIERAVLTSQASQKGTLEAADILVSLYDEEKNYCAYYLRKAGVKRYDLLSIISHGNEDDHIYDLGKKEAESMEGNEISDGSAEDDLSEAGTRTKTNKRNALERFATELTAMARENRLEPVIGREEELDRTVQVLCRRLKNNPVHV